VVGWALTIPRLPSGVFGKRDESRLGRLGLNDLPTAVGGISKEAMIVGMVDVLKVELSSRASILYYGRGPILVATVFSKPRHTGLPGIRAGLFVLADRPHHLEIRPKGQSGV